MMQTSRRGLEAYIIVGEAVWLLYGSSIESENIFISC